MRLVPIEAAEDRTRAHRAADTLRALGATLMLGDDVTINDLVTDGRR
jgi:hypothetical protein